MTSACWLRRSMLYYFRGVPVQVHMNDGRIDLIRMTIRTEHDAAVLRDAESVRVLCAATCIVVEFSDGATGSGRAAFQQLLEERCVLHDSLVDEQSGAPKHATELVAQVGVFKAACKKQYDEEEGGGAENSNDSVRADGAAAKTSDLGRKSAGHVMSQETMQREVVVF
jgi:hypothetical protein